MIFWTLSAVLGLVVLFMSLVRDAGYMRGGEWTVAQYGVTGNMVYLFLLGCLAEATL